MQSTQTTEDWILIKVIRILNEDCIKKDSVDRNNWFNLNIFLLLFFYEIFLI